VLKVVSVAEDATEVVEAAAAETWDDCELEAAGEMELGAEAEAGATVRTCTVLLGIVFDVNEDAVKSEEPAASEL